MPDAGNDRKLPSLPAPISNVGSTIADMLPVEVKLLPFAARGVVIDEILQQTESRLEKGNYLEPRLTGKSINQRPLMLVRPVTLWSTI